MTPQLKFRDDHDWTYSEGCGCRVTFFHESGFHTSKMTPDPECPHHVRRHQMMERDDFVRAAKDALRFARDCSNESN